MYTKKRKERKGKKGRVEKRMKGIHAERKKRREVSYT